MEQYHPKIVCKGTNNEKKLMVNFVYLGIAGQLWQSKPDTNHVKNWQIIDLYLCQSIPASRPQLSEMYSLRLLKQRHGELWSQEL